MLPFEARDIKPQSIKSRLLDGKFPDYMLAAIFLSKYKSNVSFILRRRLCDFRQMDFEATFDQILTLLTTEPHKVFVNCFCYL